MTHHSSTSVTPPAGAFDRALDDLRHTAAVDEAAARRARRHEHHARLLHDSSLGSVLGDLADRRAAATLVGAAGQRLFGTVTTVGRDFVALVSARRWLVRTCEIAAVVDAPGAAASAGQQSAMARLDRTFLEAVHHSADRAVVVHGATGPLAAGVLRGCGIDYLRVEEVLERRTTYVSGRAIWAVAIEAELWGSA